MSTLQLFLRRTWLFLEVILLGFEAMTCLSSTSKIIIGRELLFQGKKDLKRGQDILRLSSRMRNHFQTTCIFLGEKHAALKSLTTFGSLISKNYHGLRFSVPTRLSQEAVIQHTFLDILWSFLAVSTITIIRLINPRNPLILQAKDQIPTSLLALQKS